MVTVHSFKMCEFLTVTQCKNLNKIPIKQTVSLLRAVEEEEEDEEEEEAQVLLLLILIMILLRLFYYCFHYHHRHNRNNINNKITTGTLKGRLSLCSS
jgi:hypothetical protein